MYCIKAKLGKAAFSHFLFLFFFSCETTIRNNSRAVNNAQLTQTEGVLRGRADSRGGKGKGEEVHFEVHFQYAKCAGSVRNTRRIINEARRDFELVH